MIVGSVHLGSLLEPAYKSSVSAQAARQFANGLDGAATIDCLVVESGVDALMLREDAENARIATSGCT
jgi:hypothetical protein